jgi:hypothetical protein
MIEVGIVLLVIGALIAWFADGDVAKLGFVAAVIGLAAIILGLLLSGTEGEGVDADFLLPVLSLGLLKARF